MKKIKIAINGFGRIGRLTARNLISRFSDTVEIVAINDLTSPENLAYLFKYDSTYRTFQGTVTSTDTELCINGSTIKVFAQKDPSQLPWGELGIDVVLECTGFFLSHELASLHLQAGAQKVLLSAPAKSSDILTVVQGVNVPSIYHQNGSYLHGDVFTQADIISNASCTTNCVSPALKVIVEQFGIVNSNALTVHAYTATQPLQDGPSRKAYRDGRGGAVNMIPSSTGAAKAAALVLPAIKDKVQLSALRVPIITGSNVFLSINLEKETTVDEIKNAFKSYAQDSLKGILEYTEEPLVSTDIIQNPHSVIVDGSLIEMISPTCVKLVIWYDNEWGYSSRFAELAVNAMGLSR